MNEKNDGNQNFNVKINRGFEIRVVPEDLQKIKDFIESLKNVTIVYSHVNANRLFIQEDNEIGYQDYF